VAGDDKFASLIGSPRPQATNIVIFGANGDLTKRKLLPALAHMHRWNLLGHDCRIIGVVRQKWTHAYWVSYVHDELLKFFPEAVLNPASWQHIAEKLELVSGDLGEAETYQAIADKLHAHDGRKNALFYLAIPPAWYETVAQHLHTAGLNDESEGFRRVVIEKPFGMDLHSAQGLNRSIQSCFDESQIYRIDHYLGKEAVQNLMVFRFGNSVLEPLWNRNYIDHVQISVAESLGVGYRAGYYETSGALRDMIQSHLMQVMALVAMEPPVSLAADDVRDEKLKVLRSVRRFQAGALQHRAVRAQYAAGEVEGEVEGEPVAAYREEPGIAPESTTETFAAVKFYIDNWRWQGVPFLLRTGKRLPHRVSEICIRFREPPQKLFKLSEENVRNNELIFRLQPDEGMQLTMTAKQPGLSMHLRCVKLDASYGMAGSGMPEAYETLLHDVMLGEAGLFSRADEVEECWNIVMPILDAWKEQKDIATYAAGSMPGCDADVPGMDELLAGCQGGWRDLSRH